MDLLGDNADAWHMLRELGDLGWREFAVPELTALPSTPEECRRSALEAADCLIGVAGQRRWVDLVSTEPVARADARRPQARAAQGEQGP